jgi:hypothetical protein
MAIEDKYDAGEIIKLIDLEEPKLKENIKKVISEDLIGYDSIKDNFKLLLDYATKELKVFLVENKKYLLDELKIISIEKVKEKYTSLQNENEKVEFILTYNRLFQLNGYTAEQKLISEYADEFIKTCNPQQAQLILSEMALVYCKDFYFKESNETYDKLLKMTSENPVDINYVKSLYNASLFRIFFFKQRLAFGPYLAIGIMNSALYGKKIIDLYLKLLENITV